MRSNRRAASSGSLPVARNSMSAWSAVSVGPGWIVLTRMRRRASSLAAARMRPTCACLAATYALSRGVPMRPTALEVMMMLPPSGTCGNACLSTWKVPSTCTASTRANTSDGYSSIGTTSPLMPALLKSTSYRPYRSTPSPTARRTASSSATSATLVSASSSRAASASRSSSMPTRWRRAPSAANSRAVASPIPLSPPVMRMTLSDSRGITAVFCVLSRHLGERGPSALETSPVAA